MSRHPAARQRQQRHVHAVLRHIDRHLDQPLDLVALAAVAHVSPFHFHRVFRAWTGENLGDYLSRRRLTLAACWLCNEPAASVLTLALRAGFASGKAFSRAFKARFGLSPSQWRGASAAKRQELRNLDQAAQVALRHDGPVFSDLEPDMHVTLCQRPAVTVAYLRHTGPYGQAIAEFWRDQFVPWLHAQALLPYAKYGIGHDNPQLTDPAQCRYDACVALPPGYAPPADMLTMTIPGGLYAVYDFRGGVPEIAQAWTALFAEWLPASGWGVDARPCFEFYPEDAFFDPATGEFSCQICLAVRPLNS